jgi:predicted phosphodiesterase
VHGNLPALESFIEATHHEADAFVCLGDIVNYGPWNDECLERIYELPRIVLIEGNHERFFMGIEPIAHAPPLVQAFYSVSLQYFTRYDLIRGLRQSYALNPYICVHTIENKHIYVDTDIVVNQSYIIGHTHHQFRIIRGEYSIINCGSIGQNRQYIDVCNYAMYNTEDASIELNAIVYPFDKFLNELKRRQYPVECLMYYANKNRIT